MQNQAWWRSTAWALVVTLALAPPALAAPGLGPAEWWVSIWSLLGGLGKEGCTMDPDGQTVPCERFGWSLGPEVVTPVPSKSGCTMDPNGTPSPQCQPNSMSQAEWGMAPEG